MNLDLCREINDSVRLAILKELPNLEIIFSISKPEGGCIVVAWGTNRWVSITVGDNGWAVTGHMVTGSGGIMKVPKPTVRLVALAAPTAFEEIIDFVKVWTNAPGQGEFNCRTWSQCSSEV